MILVQYLRPDRSIIALNAFLCASLQVNSIYGKTKTLLNLYEHESAPETPILFVTTLGADPSEELETFAK